MELNSNNKGFTLIEAVVITLVIGAILALSGSISSKVAERRNIDNIAHKISSYLNLVKLQSTRNGVEYQSIFEYDSSDNTLNFSTKVGDSNRNSDFENIDIDVTEQIKMKADYQIIPSGEITLTFSPTSSLSNNAPPAITIMPSVDEENSSIKKCANIIVSRFGYIQTLIGNWDYNSSACNEIIDRQED